MLFEDLSLSKVYKEPYMNKAILYSHSRAIYSASTSRKGRIWLRTNRNWKTAAFAIPIIHQLHRIVGSSKKAKQIRALVVTPTRELAVQIGQSFDTYGKYTNLTTYHFGGVHKTHKLTP
jgi:ATP-dependent RNA helicase RhlE